MNWCVLRLLKFHIVYRMTFSFIKMENLLDFLKYSLSLSVFHHIVYKMTFSFIKMENLPDFFKYSLSLSIFQ
jgi:hypothetical protein